MQGEAQARVATRNLVLGTAAFAVAFTAFGLISPLGRRFEDSLGLSGTELSILLAVPVVLGSVLRIPVGVLTDRIGGRRAFPIVLVASAPAAVALGYVQSYVALLVVGFFLGIAGSSFAVGVPHVAGWYAKERQGFALGIYGMGNIGTAIAAFAAPVVVDGLGRPALGWGVAALLLATAFGFWRTAEDPPKRGAPVRYREVLKAGWRLYRLALLYFVTFGGFVAMAVFLPKLLSQWFDHSLVDAGLRAAGFTLVATAVRPLGGWLSDRVGASRVLLFAFLGIAADAAALAVLAADPSIVPVTIACLSMAAFLGLGSGAVFKLVPAEFPDSTGAATGIVGAAGGLGGFFPPLVMGIVHDATDSYSLGFVGLLAFCVLCLIALKLRRRTSTPIAAA